MITPREKGKKVRNYIIENVAKYPNNISSVTAKHFDISRQAVFEHIQILLEEGILEKRGSLHRKALFLKPQFFETIHLKNPKLDDIDMIWGERVLPILPQLSELSLSVCRLGFTQMLSNAILHAHSHNIVVRVKYNVLRVEIGVIDFGGGLFTALQERFQLADIKDAVFELVKGKLGYEGENKNGDGIILCSRIFDKFSILSNNVILIRTPHQHWDMKIQELHQKGTAVFMKIDKQTPQVPKETIERIVRNFENRAFVRTLIPMSILSYPKRVVKGASLAKRLMERLSLYTEVDLDYFDIDNIDEEFARLVYRDFRKNHPTVMIRNINSNENIEQAIKAVL